MLVGIIDNGIHGEQIKAHIAKHHTVIYREWCRGSKEELTRLLVELVNEGVGIINISMGSKKDFGLESVFLSLSEQGILVVSPHTHYPGRYDCVLNTWGRVEESIEGMTGYSVTTANISIELAKLCG